VSKNDRHRREADRPIYAPRYATALFRVDSALHPMSYGFEVDQTFFEGARPGKQGTAKANLR
jgi:hypothetical protein